MTWCRAAVVCTAICLAGVRAGAATLTVAWDPVGDPSVAGYILYWGTQSGSYNSSQNVGNLTENQVTNLTDGKTYYFTVRAYNGSGAVGDPSVEVSGTTSSVPVLSMTCPAPIASSSNGSPVAVTFSPVTAGGVAPISKTCSPSSGSLFPVGNTLFSCTATDAVKQTASCSSQVVVTAPPPPPQPLPLPSLPPPPPVLTLACPAPTAISKNGRPVAVTFAATALGGVAPVSTSCTPGSGSRFSVGTTLLMCTAVDAAKQVATCQSSVVVTRRR